MCLAFLLSLPLTASLSLATSLWVLTRGAERVLTCWAESLESSSSSPHVPPCLPLLLLHSQTRDGGGAESDNRGKKVTLTKGKHKAIWFFFPHCILKHDSCWPQDPTTHSTVGGHCRPSQTCKPIAVRGSRPNIFRNKSGCKFVPGDREISVTDCP